MGGDAPQQPSTPPDGSDAQQPPGQPDQLASDGGDVADTGARANGATSAAAPEVAQPASGEAPAASAPQLELLLFLDALPSGVSGCK